MSLSFAENRNSGGIVMSLFAIVLPSVRFKVTVTTASRSLVPTRFNVGSKEVLPDERENSIRSDGATWRGMTARVFSEVTTTTPLIGTPGDSTSTQPSGGP